MTVYRAGWLLVTLSLGGLGLGAAIVVMQSTLLVWLPLFAVVGLVLGLLVGIGGTDIGPWRRFTWVTGTITLGGATCVALAGLVVLTGPVAYVLAALVVISSPGAVRAGRRWLGSLPTPSAAQLDSLTRSLAFTNPTYVPFETKLDLRLFTDDHLRQALRDSQLLMCGPMDQRSLLTLVEERRRYLDELERRHPGLLGAWLSCEAGVPEGSWPDAGQTAVEPSPIDWDKLTGGQETDL